MVKYDRKQKQNIDSGTDRGKETKMTIEKYGYADSDCGRNGKAFERLCKERLHMQSKVAAPGRTDMRARRSAMKSKPEQASLAS